MARLPIRPGSEESTTAAWPSTTRGLHRAFRTTSDGQRLSLDKLAARAGISKRMVKYVQRGERGMGLEVGLRVARALGKSPWWVLEYSKRVKAAQAARKGGRR